MGWSPGVGGRGDWTDVTVISLGFPECEVLKRTGRMGGPSAASVMRASYYLGSQGGPGAQSSVDSQGRIGAVLFFPGVGDRWAEC